MREKRLWETDLFSLQKKRWTGDHIPVFSFLMGGQRGDRTRLLFKVSRDRKRSNHHNLQYRRSQFDTGKENFTTRGVKHWKRLPREVVGSPSWEMLNVDWKGPWATWANLTYSEREVGPDDFEKLLPTEIVLWIYSSYSVGLWGVGIDWVHYCLGR